MAYERETESGGNEQKAAICLNSQDLIRGLEIIQRFRKPNDPILEHILCQIEPGRFGISTTDGETSISFWIPADKTYQVPADEAESYAKVLVHPGDLINALKDWFPVDRVILSLNQTKPQIIFGPNWVLEGISASSFPEIPKAENPFLAVDAKAFQAALPRILFAAHKEGVGSVRGRVLKGVFLELMGRQMHLTASNAWQLSTEILGVTPEGPDISLVIPASALEKLRKILGKTTTGQGSQTPLNVSHSPSFDFPGRDVTSLVTFSHNGWEISSRTIDARFPPYRGVFPRNESSTKITLSRKEFLKLVRMFVKESGLKKPKLLNMETRGLHLHLSSSDGQVSLELPNRQVTLQAAIKGEPMSVTLNPWFILNSFSHLPGQQIRLSLVSPREPVTISLPEAPNFRHFIMPMASSR